jgi:hypothetical protein
MPVLGNVVTVERRDVWQGIFGHSCTLFKSPQHGHTDTAHHDEGHVDPKLMY